MHLGINLDLVQDLFATNVENVTNLLVLCLADQVFKSLATLVTPEQLAPPTPPVLLLTLITLEQLVTGRLSGAGEGEQLVVPVK